MIHIPADWSQETLQSEIRRVEIESGVWPSFWYSEYLRLLRARLEHLRRVDIGLTV